MDNNVIFKKGLSTALPSDITNGQILVTSDNGRMFIDVDENKRIEIAGDKQIKLTPDSTIIIDDDGNIRVTNPIVPITKAEYDKLTDAEKAGKLFIITDDDGDSGIKFDETPKAGSQNAVTSNGIYVEIQKLKNSISENTLKWSQI